MTATYPLSPLYVGREAVNVVKVPLASGDNDPRAMSFSSAGSPLPEFRAFSKIPRWSREVVITEKIDGTNAIVHISEDCDTVTAGSRTRWLTGHDDNFGFAAWVAAHAEELKSLGPGYHYGEWWGPGIQRGYGLKERKWSLFNVSRWGPGGKDEDKKPTCCDVVPVIIRATNDNIGVVLEWSLAKLEFAGSIASPGFMRPEGIVLYHVASGHLYKKTFDGDGHKGGDNGR